MVIIVLESTLWYNKLVLRHVEVGKDVIDFVALLTYFIL